MKKITSIFAMAAMTMLLAVVTPVQAQSRQQNRDAKKEAKRLTKEGFRTMGLPIERQLADFYNKVSQTDEEGMPKYLVETNTATGNSYAAAKMEATNVGKVRLAQQVQTTVLSEAKVQLANQSLSAEEAASITKALEKSTLMVAQKLSRVIVAQEYYRVLNNKNYEVHVALIYDSRAIKDMVLADAKAQLQKELDDFTPEYEKMVKDIIDKGVDKK